MNFSELLEKSKKDIREDESRKSQALEQFRERIKKHPFIIKCRQDDIFLLQYLRTRKYSVDAAIKTLEKNILLRKRHPEWFDASEHAVEKVKSIAKDGFVYMLKDRDACGRLVFLHNAEKFDTSTFNSNDAFMCGFLGPGSTLECEENQIMGIVYIINYTNTTWSYFASFPISDIVEWVTSTDSVPGRFKQFIVIGLPQFATKLLNIAKSSMKEKQRNRLFVLNNYDELCQHLDPKILPDRLGGTQSEEKIINNFIEFFQDKVEKLNESNTFEIDDAKANIKKDVNEAIGSFRKLEID